MAQYNRPPKIKPKKTDEFISFFDHLVRYYLQHQRKFLALAIGLLLALGVYVGYRYYLGRQFKQFAVAYHKAEQAEEKDALQQWQELKQQNPPAPLSNLVDIQIGAIHAAAGRWAEAATSFKSSVTAPSPLTPLEQFAYATSLENAKNFEQALSAYREILGGKIPMLQPEARLGIARCYLGMGKNSEAEAELNQLLATGSNTPDVIKSEAIQHLLALKLRMMKS